MFLDKLANHYGFFGKQRDVFLSRFDQNNANKKRKALAEYLWKNEEIVNQEQTFQDHLTAVCDVLSINGCPIVKPTGRGQPRKGESPWEQAFKWLWEKQFPEWLQKQRSNDSSVGTTALIAAEMDDWRRQFRSLIDIKTEGFVGRKYVFDKIEDFLSNKPNGYFTIEGDPGLGKSTILAEYVRRHECVAHFNDRLGRINCTSQFLESVCTQLIAKYRLPYSELPPDANQNKAFLEKLLSEVSEQLKPGERLVIVVDALDEVDLESQDKSANILYLPRYLPKNVYFVISRRRGVDILFVVDTPKYLFDLMAKEYADRSLQDVQTYIRQHVNEHERLRQWIQANSLTVEDFITQLADKSENNFMYLRCVLVEIEDGIYQDGSIESLPQGLENYYKDHWRLMGMTTDPPPIAKFRIVYILSETSELIPDKDIVQIIKYTGEQEAEFNVQYVLKGWKQFLHSPIMYGQTFYRFYHHSYRRFIENREDVKAAGITIENIKTLMADSNWQELYGDG
ncbi:MULTISPECIES: ATP-binding protein [unclassified Microcoleus]|uniref:ATP-binding protein n=1 Tax=unclassified Microcoleus TaxID=2642155 RepID=UPI002FD10576